MFCLLALSLLGGCGDGGTNSTPTPPPTTPTTPTTPVAPSAAPAINYNTTEYTTSEGPRIHGAITAYQAGASGAGITVGVVDTGIATGNSEFAGRISNASAAFNGGTSIMDEAGHGTAVSTILAAARDGSQTLGMAWGATILALRTDTTGSCDTSGNSCSFTGTAIAQAIDHARLNGARVINISLGSTGASSAMLTAVDRATAAGLIIVVSAGNDASAAPGGMAAAFANPAISHGLVIIAGSSDLTNQHSSFANGAAGYETATLTALGEHVNSQDQNGVRYYYSGTSISTPQIAGAVALMLDAFPNLTPAQVVARLMSSARDAGAPGADPVFGQGILNLTAAFAPTTTSLAGTAIPVSTTANGTASSAMGDVAAASISARAVVIDTLGRAYTLDPRRTFAPASRPALLGGQFGLPGRHFGLDAGPLSVALNLADAITPTSGRWGGIPQDMPAASRLISGSFAARVGHGSAIAFGLRHGAVSLLARLDRRGSRNNFLAAKASTDNVGFEREIGSAFAARTALSSAVSSYIAAETGTVFTGPAGDPHAPDAPLYRQIGIGLALDRPGFRAALGAGYTLERNSLLGARFAVPFATGPARTLFVDLQASVLPADKWELSAGLRKGWTSANAQVPQGGSARLHSSAWSFDIARSALVDPADRLALRISQPLRISEGGLGLMLPTSYDYTSARAVWSSELINLQPRGRQVDAEMSYATPFRAGWLMLNGFWRRQDGNLSWAPDVLGGTVRLTLEY